MSLKTVCASAIALAAATGAVQARDNIQIAGSSTVLPYASIVAESFGENFPDFPIPVVESGGSSAGLQRFCQGVGENQIDIANSSRRIRAGEMETCAANGVTEIMEVRVGYDGIVFASALNGPEFAFTPADWYKALAAEVVVDGEVVANPYTTWNEVNPDLPNQPILAFIPGTKHGTREVFDEKVLTAGCEESGALEALTTARGDDGKKACTALRTDGVSVDIDGDYTETLARIAANPQAFGVFGLSFYENNTDTLRVATMSDIAPSVETIATGTYPVSRPLYFYLKKAHIGVIPGLKEFAEFFMSDDMAGPSGPLAQYGLVSDPELAQTQAMIADETVMAPL
ncbi:phosphate ABC transporter periplasmic phosphate-binding protein [Ketogulonicigenium robustum]|uniref:Phosphate ABC transporter periplasmic phosphate-binding protein n=1 Tax=Ketogulonicigenium robustum TaxID=92947 RepID=A0A1W6P0L8_9RHOB|nr:substrate-binding domain-containing protein [Ketogulonicigenium robustum]ARO14989.1 phosphate ABC transporter periplasmic phosphate-binding protein [Ketogulonicigenium robustum]